jgi:prepilin-type N-terminal cleavage/methylation domain-containing protein
MISTRTLQRRAGFTILEVMIAIAIFFMVITAIYATWTSIVKGSRAAQNAAARVQRARIAVNALEASFRSAIYNQVNPLHYAFLTDTSGDMAAVSMVGRLSPAIPGHQVHQGLGVCRITFSVREAANGSQELVMTHAPMLADTNNPAAEAYSAVLARDVTLFSLQFWDREKMEYVPEWLYTNQLPQKVVIALATGKKTTGSSRAPEEVVVREVTIPSPGVPRTLQAGGPGGQGGQGQQQPPPNQQQPPDQRGPRGQDGRSGRGAQQFPGQFPPRNP